MKFKIITRIFALGMLLFVGCDFFSSNNIAPKTEPDTPLVVRHWQFFDTSNSGIPINHIRTLAVDGSQHIWIGTDSGLVQFDGSSWTLFNQTNSELPFNGIHQLAVDASENVWIGNHQFTTSEAEQISQSALVKYDGSKWTVYDSTNSILQPDESIASMLFDSNNKLWLGTSKQRLVMFNGADWTKFDQSNSPLNDLVQTMVQDKNGVIWFGARASGIFKFDGTNWENLTPANSGLKSNDIRIIRIDANDVKWIGTMDAGLAKFDNTEWKVFNSETTSIIKNQVLNLAVDNENIKWIQSSGLIKFDDQFFTKISNSPTTNTIVNQIIVDQNNTLWFATESGLLIYTAIAG